MIGTGRQRKMGQGTEKEKMKALGQGPGMRASKKEKVYLEYGAQKERK